MSLTLVCGCIAALILVVLYVVIKIYNPDKKLRILEEIRLCKETEMFLEKKIKEEKRLQKVLRDQAKEFRIDQYKDVCICLEVENLKQAIVDETVDNW